MIKSLTECISILNETAKNPREPDYLPAVAALAQLHIQDQLVQSIDKLCDRLDKILAFNYGRITVADGKTTLFPDGSESR